MLKKRKTWTDQEKDVLWERYRSGDESAYTELLESYVPMVEIIAVKTKGKLPISMEVGDLISDGFFGLVDAVKKFDPSKGYKFETYASGRIRGEIYDRLRDYDWVSRYSRLKFKQVAKTTDLLAEELQGDPTPQQIADRLEWDVEEVLKVQNSYLNSFPTNIDDYIKDSTHEFFSLEEVLEDETIGDPEFSSQYDDLADKLQGLLFKLSEQESVIMYLHHYEGLAFGKIAGILEIGAPRVSQIYSDALSTLQKHLV